MGTIENVVDRLRAEFLEMPGLSLKHDQVQRLCGIEQRICQTVLDALVREGFLCAKPGGRYARCTDGGDGAQHLSRFRPYHAAADLSSRALALHAS